MGRNFRRVADAMLAVASARESLGMASLTGSTVPCARLTEASHAAPPGGLQSCGPTQPSSHRGTAAGTACDEPQVSPLQCLEPTLSTVLSLSTLCAMQMSGECASQRGSGRVLP